ncbi:MAG: hypothetical protein AB8F94_06990 [Saprospiraceae bacterium]
MKKICVLLLVLGFSLNELYGSRCERPYGKKVKKAAEGADEIFLGKVKMISDSSIHKEYIFEISEKWKGSKSESIKLKYYYTMAGSFTPGEKEWIILTSKDSEGMYSAAGCSPIYAKNDGKIFKDIEKNLNELFPNKVFSETDEQSYSQRFLIILVITTALILGFIFGKNQIKKSKKVKKNR